jgi:hypothetical protein
MRHGSEVLRLGTTLDDSSNESWDPVNHSISHSPSMVQAARKVPVDSVLLFFKHIDESVLPRLSS